MSEHRDCEVLVVGSGAGGAPTAAVLAEAGHDVLVVEEGPWIAQGDTMPFSLDQMERQYRSAGLTVAVGRPGISYAEARCVGGGTEINSGLYRRPTTETLDRWRRGWSIADLSDDDFDRWSATVEADIEVQPVPGRHHPGGDRLRTGATRLAWAHRELPRWMRYPTDGAVAPDASSGRRNSMTRTYLPRALAAGARLVADRRVDRFIFDRRRAFRAEFTGPEDEPGTVDFDRVVVCAGAIHTPALLQRSGCRRLVGRRLALHPTVKLAARFDDRIDDPADVPVHQVTEFAPELSLGGSASQPGLIALALADSWATMGHAIESWREMAVFYAAIQSSGRGRVRSIPGSTDPIVSYRLTRRDRSLLGTGLARLTQLVLEAGAVAVYPSIRGGDAVDRGSDIGALAAAARARASVMSVHLCSTVPMGEDTERAAADSYGRVHGTDNVFVNDAALLPDAPGVNPQAAIMAIALRNAHRLAAD